MSERHVRLDRDDLKKSSKKSHKYMSDKEMNKTSGFIY